MRKFCLSVAFLLPLAAAALLRGDEPGDEPKPIPATRPEIKAALAALQLRTPRLPIPADAQGGDGPVNVGNGAARRYFLPEGWAAADFKTDPSMPLEYPFRTQMFWIVSRGNNCQYCLGHQEHKLAMVGFDDDAIAALDSDWSRFTPAEQAAFEFTRKLTLAPWLVEPADVAQLQQHYDEQALVDLVYTVSMFNAVNRWTDALGLPQDRAMRGEPIHFDQPTSPEFAAAESIIAPWIGRERPELESPSEMEAQLTRCAAREPLVTYCSAEEASARLGRSAADPPPAPWMRVLCKFQEQGPLQVKTFETIWTTGRLPALLKAQIAWTTARQNRAWCALAVARQRLLDLGQTEEAIYALDDLDAQPAPLAQALRFSRKLTSYSARITDADIALLRELFSDFEVAEIVYVTGAQNEFDRLTEALRLPSAG